MMLRRNLNDKVNEVKYDIPSNTNSANHCVKSVCIWSYYGLHFLAFGMNTRKNQNTKIFYAVNTIAFNAKINEVKNKISNILTQLLLLLLLMLRIKFLILIIQSKKKIDYNIKISEVENKNATDRDHDKYITTQEFNNLISEKFLARLAQVNFARKIDIAKFIKNTDFDDKLNYLYKNITSNKTEYALV